MAQLSERERSRQTDRQTETETCRWSYYCLEDGATQTNKRWEWRGSQSQRYSWWLGSVKSGRTVIDAKCNSAAGAWFRLIKSDMIITRERHF